MSPGQSQGAARCARGRVIQGVLGCSLSLLGHLGARGWSVVTPSVPLVSETPGFLKRQAAHPFLTLYFQVFYVLLVLA